MSKLQVNGNMTIIKSNVLLSAEDRQKFLTASPGKAKALRVTLMDKNGRELVLQTFDLKVSSSRNITGRFNLKLDDFEVVEVDAKGEASSPKKNNEEALRKELGLD